MALNFTTTDRASVDHGVKILTYGGAGAGKTTFCSTAPAPLIISAESGLLSLRKVSIPVLIVNDIADVWDALKWFQDGSAAKAGIMTACLDSISEIVEKSLNNHKKKTKDPRQAYGAMAEESIELVKAFRDLQNFHVIVTSKMSMTEDPITGSKKAMPTAPGQQVGPALPYLFDEVFYAYTDKDPKGVIYHAVQTHKSFQAEAKDRSGVLDDIEYPDANHLITKILTGERRANGA